VTIESSWPVPGIQSRVEIACVSCKAVSGLRRYPGSSRVSGLPLQQHLEQGGDDAVCRCRHKPNDRERSGGLRRDLEQ